MEHDRRRDDRHPQIIRHELALRSVFSIIAIAAGLWLLVQLWQIILLLIIALILAGTVSPLVTWLKQHRFPHTAALGLVLVLFVLAIAGLGALVIPALVTQMAALVASAPVIQEQLADYLASLPILAGSASAVRKAQPTLLLEPLGAYALTFASAAAQGVILGLTAVVLAVYMLADSQRVKGFAFALLPRRFHLRSARILLDMETVVGGYVRGQALTSLLIGLFVYAVLWVAGTPNPLALAVFAAFADLIPFVGGFLVLAPAALATLPQGALPAALVALALLIYFQVEGHVLIPRIYGQTLRLSSLAVLVALLIGGQLLGIVGALLALPIAASLRVLIEQLRIDLPGEHPGEDTQRTLDAVAEAEYAAQTAGVSALAASELATVMAEQAQEDQLATTGTVDVPIEERGDSALVAEGTDVGREVEPDDRVMR
ncbi:MAG: AI-2E family transporter [Roseiflexaceae bacterium]